MTVYAVMKDKKLSLIVISKGAYNRLRQSIYMKNYWNAVFQNHTTDTI